MLVTLQGFKELRSTVNFHQQMAQKKKVYKVQVLKLCQLVESQVATYFFFLYTNCVGHLNTFLILPVEEEFYETYLQKFKCLGVCFE